MSSLQRIVTVVLMAGQLSACTAWRVETLSPAEVIGTQHPTQVRVQRSDGHRQVLYQPAVQGDSLVGRRWDDDKAAAQALPLTDVRQVATRHVSGGRTTGLLLGIGALVAMMAAISASLNGIGLGN